MIKIIIKEIKKEMQKDREWVPTGRKKVDEYNKETDEFAYAYYDIEREVEKDIFTQTVQEINLVNVIKAINNLE